MNDIIPLTDLELFNVITAAYPEKFPDDRADDDGDNNFYSTIDFAGDISGVDGISDLLGRVILLTMPAYSPLNGKHYHSLGTVTVKDGNVDMCALVKRKVLIPDTEEAS